ncbi:MULTISPECIES: UDP-glucose/GDP-mannose dehydrogenase family protein [Thermocrispum]|uniref:UDP-glucose 6-dehydrogenase n=1 Tax=Thermocrispum agreste TaxID=37925 RepID=A0A2W4JE21_9PSEU|nr:MULTISPECIES: UDP-glucose/GDP-mannose dehydrogenase family protein [Thermocrispum]PZM96681.1 MAG: nucleotide sugar dehydrogenase [Thermocrispum agreste]
MRIAVIGAGYVGLVTGVGLAEHGHRVVCVDVDAARVDVINAGRAPIFETGLDDLLAHHIGAGFTATTDLAGAVSGSDVTFICVGTPARPDGSIDTSFVTAAAAEVGGALRPGSSVVVKSTVVPGTTDGPLTEVLAETSGLRPGQDFGVGANPEFLTEGQAVADFLDPDRIVIGGDDLAVAALREVYAGFAGTPLVQTNARTAEMIKYASNAMLATAISFTNELANLGAALGGVDTTEVMRGVHLSRYLTAESPGPAGLAAFFAAGCGYGGSCLPKDVAALTALGEQAGSPLRVLQAVAAVNDEQPVRLADIAERALGGLAGRRVTVLGLAFKPDTDDTRHSPAFPVIRQLRSRGADVVVHDPVVGAEAVAGIPGVTHVADLPVAVKGADAVVLVTRWEQYQRLPEVLSGLGANPLVVDGRRALAPSSVPRYAGIGR